MSESDDRHDHLVGILGGMGPAATADFYAKLIRRTPASKDQEHLRVAIWADPTVPDRVGAVLDGSSDPYPSMLAGAGKLHDLGATIVAMPCHTAHLFLPRLESDTGLRFVDMVRETVSALVRGNGGIRTAGLLATTATLRSGLYQKPLAEADISTVTANEGWQLQVDAAIGKVKSGEVASARPLVEGATRALAQSGAEVVILACTEIPIALRDTPAEQIPAVLDPTDLLAEAVVRECVRSR
ncbi:MAG: aspartate/glutamate racemase family protein [Sciscionella sp.]